jgi:hypothetical protein
MAELHEESLIWRHKKSGGLYKIVSRDAFLENSMVKAVVYESLWDGQVWVRPASEFFDGRFQCLNVDEVIHG